MQKSYGEMSNFAKIKEFFKIFFSFDLGFDLRGHRFKGHLKGLSIRKAAKPLSWILMHWLAQDTMKKALDKIHFAALDFPFSPVSGQ